MRNSILGGVACVRGADQRGLLGGDGRGRQRRGIVDRRAVQVERAGVVVFARCADEVFTGFYRSVGNVKLLDLLFRRRLNVVELWAGDDHAMAFGGDSVSKTV